MVPNGIIVANSWNFIVIPILNVIIHNKIDEFSLDGFIRGFSIPTDRYHTDIGIRSAIGMSEERAGN